MNSEILFPRFLDDSNEYVQAERLWSQKFEEIVSQFGERSLWDVPWLATAFVDGVPFQDGNPIFSAICWSRNKAIRVIQENPAAADGGLSVWSDIFDADGPSPITELVISCVLTEDALNEAMQKIQFFVRPRAGQSVPHAESGILIPLTQTTMGRDALIQLFATQSIFRRPEHIQRFSIVSRGLPNFGLTEQRATGSQIQNINELLSPRTMADTAEWKTLSLIGSAEGLS
jgi:hypothetical protein